jgi:diguanylate cyclase (GGDEF)-like protein
MSARPGYETCRPGQVIALASYAITARHERQAQRILALDRVFAARRRQTVFRVVTGIILALGFGPILGWRATLPVLAVYGVLQLVEFLGFQRAWHRISGQGRFGLEAGLTLLALNSVIFGLPSVCMVLHFGPWGVACAGYLLTGATVNCVQLTLGSRSAYWASTLPFFLYAALIPFEVRLVSPAVSAPVLAGLGVAAVILAASVTKQWLQWDAARLKEAAAVRAQQVERDVNERRLLKLAQQDALTGLGNRDVLHNALGAALNSRRPGALFIIDLDGFKDINDMRGHGIGDEVLREIAARIAGGCREIDTVTRLGGDEFALVLPGLEAAAVEAAAAGLLGRIGNRLKLRDDILAIGASIGVALFPEHGQDAGQLLANADLALYQAKADGRHCHRVYDAAMREQALEKIRLDSELRLAADRGEFELFYQPQIRLSDGALMGAEALLRWHHPERGLLAPAAFIGALETSVLAMRLGQWILETACGQAAYWRSHGLPNFRIGVNLFGVQVRSVAILSLVRAACAKANLPPAALEIEITENIILRQEDEIIAPLRALRDLGVGLAFDDYGTGYASLSLLKRYPVSKLKIDRVFISEICESEEDAVIVFGLINMARALGMGVIAEGVETQAQAALLARNGCAEAQGYAFGLPVPAADFERSWLPAPAIARAS